MERDLGGGDGVRVSGDQPKQGVGAVGVAGAGEVGDGVDEGGGGGGVKAAAVEGAAV